MAIFAFIIILLLVFVLVLKHENVIAIDAWRFVAQGKGWCRNC
jgi:hypothetical protein